MSSSSTRLPTPDGPGPLPDSYAPKEETLMPHTRETPQGGAHDARIVEQHHIVDPRDRDEIEAIDGGGRRWYHLRPEPRRRTDLMGFNSTLWMALGWLIVIVLLVFPFPWVVW